MWKSGTETINGHKMKWEAKVYDEGSQFGINKGRISKLWISQDGEQVCNYDRGWDVRPKTPEAKQVYNMLIAKFN